MTIYAGAYCECFGGHASCEPENLVDIVDGHVRQNAAALIAVRCRIGIFQCGKDLKHSADGAILYELFRVLERFVKAPLEGKHQRVGMVAVEFGGERAITVERSG